MFEYESGVSTVLDEGSPFVAGALEQAIGARITRRAGIVWQEHCSECAMPSCYSSCAFYSPRWDYKCRRFTGGVTILPPTDHTASPMRFRFGKWARLLGHGPMALRPVSRVMRDEAAALQRAQRANAMSMFRGALAPALRRRVNNRSRTTAFGTVRPEALFLLAEAFNPEQVAVELSFTCSIQGPSEHAEGRPPFQCVLSFEPGYSVRLLPLEQALGGVAPSKFSMEFAPRTADTNPEIIFGLIDVVELGAAPRPEVSFATAKPTSSPMPKVKCVIWDLDNTIWDGTLVEDGVENLRVRPESVAAIRELDAKGILQSIASKNDPEPVRSALEAFGLAEFFVAPQISWQPKSGAIHTIAQRLNISADTFAFVDDQEFERAEVASRHPEVLLVDSRDLRTLLAHPRLDVEVTAEAMTRRRMYREEEQRTVLMDSAGGDYEQFLRSCEMKVDIRPLSEQDLARAHELAQRTNQLNTWTSRYTIDELRALLDQDTPRRAFTVRAEDRFGTYGLIGLCVVDVTQRFILDLMFSCRIQGKLVSESFLAWLSWTQGKSSEPLRARFKATKKNSPVRSLLDATGFEHRGEYDSGELWVQNGPFRSLDELSRILRVVDAQCHATQSHNERH